MKASLNATAGVVWLPRLAFDYTLITLDHCLLLEPSHSIPVFLQFLPHFSNASHPLFVLKKNKEVLNE